MNKNRKLGQHFLINKLATQKIITALELEKNDRVIEIGPGKGALTAPLAKKCRKVNCDIIAIEKDPNLAKWLASQLAHQHQISIMDGDALKVLPTIAQHPASTKDHFKIAGNIPYYITGKLLRTLGELENKPKLTILTVQRQVAERLISQPPTMNLLAAAVQIWAQPEIVGYLKPTDFVPAPKVDSAIIKLITKSQLLTASDATQYYKLIKAIFKQPRKTVLNNLQAGLDKTKVAVREQLKKANLTGQERPQNLNIDQLKKLAILFY